MTKKTNNARHLISFTVNDENVLKWLDKQDNTSLSLRLLIDTAINSIGYCDYVSYLSKNALLAIHTNGENPQKETTPMNDFKQSTSLKPSKTHTTNETKVSQGLDINYLGLNDD